MLTALLYGIGVVLAIIGVAELALSGGAIGWGLLVLGLIFVVAAYVIARGARRGAV